MTCAVLSRRRARKGPSHAVHRRRSLRRERDRHRRRRPRTPLVCRLMQAGPVRAAVPVYCVDAWTTPRSGAPYPPMLALPCGILAHGLAPKQQKRVYRCSLPRPSRSFPISVLVMTARSPGRVWRRVSGAASPCGPPATTMGQSCAESLTVCYIVPDSCVESTLQSPR